MIKKANRLGWSQRTIHRVYSERDDDGRHIYFEVDAIKSLDQQTQDMAT